ncbi:MAG: hypothetical protein QG604_285 [Candidatus Dependentiae bacterium]|nr:hypothetical protein [Candidatus Dependentiae bacterium]
MKKYLALVLLVSIASFTTAPLKSRINPVALEVGAIAVIALSVLAYNKLLVEPDKKDRKLIYDIALSLSSQEVTDDEEEIKETLRSHNVDPTPAIVASWQTVMGSFEEFAAALTRVYAGYIDQARGIISDVKIDMKELSPRLRKAVAKIRKNLKKNRSSRKDRTTSSGTAFAS